MNSHAGMLPTDLPILVREATDPKLVAAKVAELRGAKGRRVRYTTLAGNHVAEGVLVQEPGETGRDAMVRWDKLSRVGLAGFVTRLELLDD